MALADLALQMSGWNTVVRDLIERLVYLQCYERYFNNSHLSRFKQDISTISVLLDVLIVLPEEVCMK